MAVNFGLANEYNVFVFGNMSMSNTDSEGRVAVGGNAILSNYGIGSGVIPLSPANADASFVVNGDMNVTSGSNASGDTVVNPSSTIINYTMGNPNGSLILGTPIDFAEAEQYLKCASLYWNTLAANGSGEVVFNQLNLTGTDENLNVFTFDGNNIYGTGLTLSLLNGINIIAPINSTILINITGNSIQYGSYQIFRNGNTATRENAKRIVWNFPEALTWSNSTTAIYGSVLAPFAAANTTFSQINGNIIFDSFTGNSESHNELFIGELPEPEGCLLTTTTTSSTSTTTSTTTTTSSTSTTSTTTAVPIPSARSQAITNLFQSVALQQAALSHILNAEGEKLQKILFLDGTTSEEILLTNKSVESMVNSIADLEMILSEKLNLFEGCKCR